VQYALSHGVPLVVAGETSDKAEVAARVDHTGVGVDLGTSMPTAAASLLQSCAAGISFRDAAWGCSAVGTVFGVEKIWGSRSPAPRRSKGDAVPAQTPTALFARLRGGGTPALRSAAASLGAKSWAGGHCSQRSSLSP